MFPKWKTISSVRVEESVHGAAERETKISANTDGQEARGGAVARWLRRKFAGSIPGGVIGIFH
jgi:hypothetical protein